MPLGTATASSLLSTALATRKFHSPGIFVGHKVTDSGGRVGYGQHGDYLFGWKGDALQKAMDALPSGKCANANCSVLKIQSAQAAMTCKKPQEFVENVGQDGGWIPQIPGGVAVSH